MLFPRAGIDGASDALRRRLTGVVGPSEELAGEVVNLAEQRRVVGHFRRPLDSGTLMSRMAGMLPFDHKEGLVSLLLGDAGRALRTAFRLAYSPDEGLWRIRLYES
jgi:hypothetical protein